ncbi:Regulatory protein RecX [Clostridium sp. N3C]|uniref:recombination regulator RecX n=1 Tax=Clostridium sp. N3C TaxID=1776758 RepID=UPI00092DF0A0|nr:recombination regulator RecX [Clostridium sp. N3C]NLZ35781.1 recombination regulator RecX [Clostridiales bacterium]SCN21413.1 Regulatory protein RecX [Clostridium sp. N3C]
MENIITKVEVQKNNKNRVNVYVDDEYAFSCDTELVYKYDLKKQRIINLEELKEIIAEDNYMKAKNAALKYIERTYKTEKEMKDKLINKGYDEATIKRVIIFLKEYNFLDDRKYAELYIKTKQKNAGKNKIKIDLLKKGVSHSVIESVTENLTSDSEEESARVLAEKKHKTIIKRERDKRKVYEKLIRFLVSKGFTWELSKSVINKLMNYSIED